MPNHEDIYKSASPDSASVAVLGVYAVGSDGRFTLMSSLRVSAKGFLTTMQIGVRVLPKLRGLLIRVGSECGRVTVMHGRRIQFAYDLLEKKPVSFQTVQALLKDKIRLRYPEADPEDPFKWASTWPATTAFRVRIGRIPASKVGTSRPKRN